ncbi:MAG TPA: hypothetical protein VGJ20_43440 [Xanthobacteraceae bacterium]|jgi:hypothetical protein
MDSWLNDQWQVAQIWMSDVNRVEAERTPGGMLTRLASRDIAEYQLNRYFEMVEVELSRAQCNLHGECSL